MNSREAAHVYAARYGMRVFPLAPHTTKPFKGSRGYKDGTSDYAEIDALWARYDASGQQSNVAAWTHDLVVIDVDGHAGEENLWKLIREARRIGHNNPWPATLTHLSPTSPGAHYIFAADPDRHVYGHTGSDEKFTSGGRCMPSSIDVKARRSSIVLAPSVRSGQTGKCDGFYSLLTGPGTTTAIQPVPAWVLDVMSPLQEDQDGWKPSTIPYGVNRRRLPGHVKVNFDTEDGERRISGDDSGAPDLTGLQRVYVSNRKPTPPSTGYRPAIHDRAAYAQARAKKEYLRAFNAPVGRRQDELRTAAFCLGTFVGAGLLERQQAHSILVAALLDRGDTPVDKAVTNTIGFGIADGALEPHRPQPRRRAA